MPEKSKKPTANSEAGAISVKETMPLFDFLIKQFPQNSRSSLKNLLSKSRIHVNGKPITAYNHPLEIGDKVVIVKQSVRNKQKLSRLSILFEDEHIIVIDKEAGLLSITGVNKDEITAFRILSQHLKEEDKGEKVYIIHRLDQDTSGVMMFAKSLKAQEEMQKHWNKYVKDRKYITVVEGLVEQAEGTVTSWLTENQTYKVFSSFTDNGGQKAVLDFTRLNVGKKFTMLEVSLDTGRKNQIRVQMHAIGHPVVGDKKYGATSNPIRRIALHAKSLYFLHPITQKEMRFEVPVPKSFYNLLKV